MHQSLKNKFYTLLGKEWFEALEWYLDTDDFNKTITELVAERKIYDVFPEQGSDLLFKAFRTTPLSKVKVVILGQDMQNDGTFDGFAFSHSDPHKRVSLALYNILTEIENDMYNGFQLVQNPRLERLADQGVLLINVSHTVRSKQAISHFHMWIKFTNAVILSLIKRQEAIAWMIWGRKSQLQVDGLNFPSNHLLLNAYNPSSSSESTGFIGCKHFSKANDFLIKNNVKPITW